MPLILQPTPIAEAVAKMEARSPVASVLRSAEWAEIPVALRESAFFSAGVDWADFLVQGQTKILAALAQRKEQVARGNAFVDRSSFIGDMRRLVISRGKGIGDRPSDLTDLASRARLGLIFDMQTQSAMGHARWKYEQRPAVLNAFPAQELLPSTARKPRDWDTIWDANNGPRPTGAGRRLVALKTDPIWTAISRFGVPWPPFDFGSTRELRDLDRAEAETIGLIAPDDELQPGDAAFNEHLQASAADLPTAFRDLLSDLFGNQIQFRGDRALWRPKERAA